MKAGVFGVGGALPDEVVTNADLVSGLDTTEEWIERRTGIRERRRMNGDGLLADLAAEACAAALEDAGRRPGEIDRVLVSTITADHLTPGLAPEVAQRLGAAPAGAIDINAACAGFVYGLESAAALVDSGRAGLVLVCGAEALSRITDHQDRATAVLFGDGAGAVVVGPGELELGVGAVEVGCDGDKAALLYADPGERLLRMSGRQVYRHGISRLVEATGRALERARISSTELDLLVCHQANARIVEAAAAELGIPPDRVLLDIESTANTSSASIPLALWRAEREGRVWPGARVALAAFGAGFVWGATVISWKERVHVCA